MKLSASLERGAPRPAPLRLEGFLPYRLSVLTNHISAALARRYRGRFGLTIPQWRVMAVLGADPGLSAGEVAARTAMDKVTVSRAVARLVAAGLVLRSTCASDRRRAVLRLSARGRGVYERIVPLARSYEAELLSALDPRDRRALDRALARLGRAARAIEGDGEAAR